MTPDHKLVPVEPTEAMYQAASASVHAIGPNEFRKIYAAAIAAAPPPPAEVAGGELQTNDPRIPYTYAPAHIAFRDGWNACLASRPSPVGVVDDAMARRALEAYMPGSTKPIIDNFLPQMKAALQAAALTPAAPVAPPVAAGLTAGGLSAEDGVSLIATERRRQIDAEYWTPEHDDQHEQAELSRAAVCYAAHASAFLRVSADVSLATYQTADVGADDRFGWPWDDEWWKPSTPIRDLVKAGALIAAEIDRLRRLSAQGQKS